MIFFFCFLVFFFLCDNFSSFFKNVNWFYLLADLLSDFLICFFLYVTSGVICVFTHRISTVFKFLAAAGLLDKDEKSKLLGLLTEESENSQEDQMKI